jgi:RNA-directed DNA polymerase
MSCSLYDINQCIFYKLNSKSKLSNILGISLKRLKFLARNNTNYRIFLLREEICPYTFKVTKERWVQEPKEELRKIHDRVRKILMRLQPPDYSHAAVKGRSYRSNALAHKDSARVATFDIRKFYEFTSKSRIFSFFFEEMMCSHDVAEIFAGLLSYSAPVAGSKSSLPTGSPVSPILSLYANKPMFDEISRLSVQHHLKFTCYVDDLTFSGPVIPLGFGRLLNGVVERHGHQIALAKSRIFSANQSKHVTGVVIYQNILKVPHSRFWKARALGEAIINTKNLEDKILLRQKLSGLLGEAAYLDSSYHPLAKRSYIDLKKLKEAHYRELLFKEANSLDI